MKKLFFLAILCVSLPTLPADALIGSKLQEKLLLRNSGSLRVFVMLKGNLHPESAMDAFSFTNRRESRNSAVRIVKARAEKAQEGIREAINRMQKNRRVSTVRHFWLINAISLHADDEAIRELSRRDDVAQITLIEKTMRVSPIRVENPKRNIEQTNLEFVNADIVADEEEGFFITGFDVTVAVLDTGLSDDQIAAGQFDDNFGPGTRIDPASTSLVAAEPFTDDLEGHGTHTAGIVASAGFGVAIDANIMTVKVLDGTGSGFLDDVAAGVQHAFENGADIVNMSLGGPVDKVANKPLDDVIKAAAKLGVIFAVAAGNDGPVSKTINNPGNLKEVMSVGAISTVADGFGNFPGIVADFSSRGPKGPDFSCPGVQIPSLALNPANDPEFLSGTSEATPHVAGIAAMALELIFTIGDAKFINKFSNPKQLEKFFIKNGCDGLAVKNDTGGGYLNALTVVVALLDANGDLDRAAVIRELRQRKKALRQQNK